MIQFNPKIKHITLSTILAVGIAPTANAQNEDTWNAASGLNLDVEVQGVAATGDYAPLWLSSNKYGMGSVENLSAYERISATRSEQNDSTRKWRLGYGLDIAVQEGAESTFFIQQAYASIAYKKLRLIVGAKETPLDIKNPELTSGSLSMGMNAHPIPMVKGEIDYFSIPGTNDCWKWKVSGAYGMTTDGNWQEDFTGGLTRYTGNVLYHEKRIYWKFGKEYVEKCPLTFEIGLRMATQFGGTTYHANGRNVKNETLKHSNGLKAYWDALICGGSDETDGTDPNTAGNHLGSYNLALAWTTNDWMVRAYAERYFDDQSMITFQYGVQDHLIGIESELPKNRYLTGIVLEHMSTRNQSGAVYHDQTVNIPDKMNGRDNYYNHGLYSGWQHWGMTLGHPFITSPIYNSNNILQFYNNRVKAWHVGLSGDPTDQLHWRMLLSFTENWGTYGNPYNDKKLQQYCMGEITYKPKCLKNWSGKLAIAYDHGTVIGNSFGGQLTIHKTFNLVR